MSAYGNLTARGSQLANRHGIYLGRRSTKIHVALYRRSGGRLGSHLPGWPEVPIVLVDHIGAKSATKRTSPLMYHRQGRSVVVAASKAGQATNPAWFHNLMKNPDTTIQVGREVRSVHARVADGDERGRLWSQLVAMFPGYEFFRQSAGNREIPVVVLDPRQQGRATPSNPTRDDEIENDR